tara:strand:+ start:1153 stop:1569 length:417 start_codon:yes stop_codon:yes gene_type:complete
MSALSTLYSSIFARLTNDPIWSDRVYPDMVPANKIRPYVVYFITAGGESNTLKKDDAEFIIAVKCVSTKLSESLSGSSRISELLNNQGSQDSGLVSGDSDWIIKTITQGRVIQDVEMIKNSIPLYNSGQMFRITMEKK